MEFKKMNEIREIHHSGNRQELNPCDKCPIKPEKMNIGIVGYKRHAAKHIDIINKSKTYNLKIYHPSRCDTRITNNLRLLLCDCIIISSPTNTHLSYLRKLANKNFKEYLSRETRFCKHRRIL